MTKLGTWVAAMAAGLGMSTSAHAVVLTFEGNICDTVGNVCGNGSRILQTYGDIAGQLDVIYDNDINNAVGDTNFYHWNDAYSGLTHVAYGNSGATVEIFLKPLSGWKLSGLNFDIGGWPNADRNTQVTVLDDGGGPPLLSTGPIVVLGTTPSHFTVAGSSTDGYRIQFGPDGYNAGIDNIAFDLTQIVGGGIPEPNAWALMILGFAGAGAMLRRGRRAITA